MRGNWPIAPSLKSSMHHSLYLFFVIVRLLPVYISLSSPSIMSFSTIPILDLSLAKDPSTKPQFLQDLRHALLEVGFLYLKNVGVPEELTQAVIKEGVSFFDLPMEEKFVVPSSLAKTPPFYLTCNPFSRLHLLISYPGSKLK